MLGVHLEADLGDFPVVAESFEQSRRVRCSREGAEEAAVTGFDDIGDAGEALPGKQGRLQAGLGGAAGMQAFHHRAFLGGHQPGAERARDAQRLLHAAGVELQQAAGGGRGDERARRALRMKAVEEEGGGRGVADPDADLGAERDGGSNLAAGEAAIGFGQRQGRGRGERVGMQDRLLVDVVHLERVARRAVDQDGVREPGPVTAVPDRGPRIAAFLHDHVADMPGPGKRRAVQADAEPVEEAEFHAIDHAAGKRFSRRVSRKAGQVARGVGENGFYRTAHVPSRCRRGRPEGPSHCGPAFPVARSAPNAKTKQPLLQC
jgi:hypothetical protein